ncbi:MAG: hypothetical protein ACREUH_11265 [Burkholderiales bacterium]
MIKKNQDHLALKDARNLLARLQEGEPFRDYVQDRLRLVLPALAVFVLVSLACAAATAVAFADLSSWLTLPGFLLAPAVLVGSLYVQGLVFFSWLEARALALALGHRPRGVVGELPPVPWLLAALALLVPLALLVTLAPVLAVVLAAAAAMVPFLYVRLDRSGKSRLTRPRAAV